MAQDVWDRLEAALIAACKKHKAASRIRCVPRPRQELTDALRRCQAILSHYAPELQNAKLTTLYEYAAARLLRESIPAPDVMAKDFHQYLQDYPAWWEQWRNHSR